MEYADVVFNAPMRQTYTYIIPDGITCKTGQRVTVPLGRRTVTGFVVHTGDTAPKESYVLKPISRVIDKKPVFGSSEIELAEWMSKLYLCSHGEALAVMIPGGRRDSAIPALAADEEFSEKPHNLTTHQIAAVEAICSGEKSLYYLFGVTGSGKTEVFLQAAERKIAAGRSVIYLVPEITLTHQLSDQVKNRFAGRVAVLHSAITPSQRLAEWMRIRRGEVDIVIGARSAIFAPLENPGLIIIDEEHENSYKSGSSPRYHARQIALHRSTISGAALVMGSATPSLEAWHLMKIGRIQRLELPERVSGGSMPKVEVVDMSFEESAFSRKLQQEIRSVLQKKRQVILFLNRRGFSYFFHCRTCGYEMTCNRCSVSLTYHKERNRMVCHYCGHSRQPVSVCPECGSLDIGYSGFGTEMIEAEVSKLFPQARAARLDTDAARKKDVVKNILSDFRNGDIDILLGTQMVAKGLNFPGVDLVGIILADSALHLPDFRAQERTFSLIMQVSGRSGRFSNDGKVIVQTYKPENSAVRLGASGDIELFCEQELEMRRLTKFPPYTRLSRLVFRSKDVKKVVQLSDQAGKILGDVIKEIDCAPEQAAEILGPAECPLSKISGNWRWQIIIRSSSLNILHQVTAMFMNRVKKGSGIFIEVDIDPVNLL
ncbi:MAG: primosomal protein N' [Spirochaetales bacterium]|nr:primosomal protein N' [Spirochaetales bacterium]